MPMRIKAHVLIRIGLMFAGFFGGAIAHMIFFSHAGGIGSLLFFILPLAGAVLLPQAFASMVPSTCPKCGAAAATSVGSPFVYVCGGCGTQSNAAVELMGGGAALREQMRAAEKERPARGRRLLWIFLAVGTVAMGFGAWLSVDSVRLVRDGVSVTAQVMKVTMSEGRDKDGNRELRYTAQIQYKVGATPMILERNWTQSPNSRCFAGCYDQGEMLKIRYLPEDPATARVDSIGDLYLRPGIPLLVGLVFVAFALLMLRRKP
jgi:hypothetical protein